MVTFQQHMQSVKSTYKIKHRQIKQKQTGQPLAKEQIQTQVELAKPRESNAIRYT